MKLICAIAAASAVACVNAAGLDGNAMLQWHLSAAPPMKDTATLAYLRGVVDSETTFVAYLRMRAESDPGYAAVWAQMRPLMFCLPANSDGTQAYDIFIRYLQEKPEFRHQPPNVLVRAALANVWPCGR